MRADFELFNRQLCILGRNESRVFKDYLSGEKDIGAIAEEEGIQVKKIKKEFTFSLLKHIIKA